MKIIVAIDSLKGCLTSSEANHAIAEGLSSEAKVVECIVSDGGEGWTEAYGKALSLGDPNHQVAINMIEAEALDPLLRPIRTTFLQQGELAVIEIAKICGLGLLRNDERNPLRATSYGLGQLITNAVARGCRRFIIGLGGSATSDAGRGMVQALRDGGLLDEDYHIVCNSELTFTIASDVTNPLYGPHGAAKVFAPQKGADPTMVLELDKRAQQFAETNAHKMGYDCSQEAGAGAAGGVGYALMQFLGAQCSPGAELLLETMHFDQLLADADFVITGEGCADRQTLMGKLPFRILQHARAAGIPCHLLAGKVEDSGELLAAGFASIHCINPPSLSMRDVLRPDVARSNLSATALQVIMTTQHLHK